MLKKFTLALLFLAITQPAFAGIDPSMPEPTFTEWQTITVDDSVINIPPPTSFIATSKKMPELATVFKQYFPANTALYEIFVEQKNIDALRDGSQQDLKKYFVITQPIEMQNKNFSKKDLAGIAEAMKKDGNNLFDNQIKDEVESRLKKGNDSLSKMIDEKVDIQLTRMGFLGISEATENAVIFSLRADLTADKASEKVTVITSAAFFLVDNKIIMLAAYASEYDSESRESGLAWTQSEVSKWTKDILLANNSTGKGK